MISYKLRQNTNKLIPASYLKWYAVPIINETVSLDGLAAHMAAHNTPYSKGVIKGILTDMVSCIKEEIANGKAVKIDDLAIFKVGIVNKKGCEDKSTYKASEYISGVRLKAQAVGEFSYSQLNSDITLKRASLDKDDSGNVDAGDTGEVDNSSNTNTGSGDNSGGGSVVDPLA